MATQCVHGMPLAFASSAGTAPESSGKASARVSANAGTAVSTAAARRSRRAPIRRQSIITAIRHIAAVPFTVVPAASIMPQRPACSREERSAPASALSRALRYIKSPPATKGMESTSV